MTAAALKQKKTDYWLAEKSVSALRSLTAMAQVLDRAALREDDIDELRDHLHVALAYTATIVSASADESGPPYGPDVAAAIAAHGLSAMEDFVYARGLIAETTLMAETREICEILHRIGPLLEGPRGETRTRICEIMAGYRGRSSIVRTISDLTEQVTNGELTWPEYCDRSRWLIRTHQCPNNHKDEENEAARSD